LLSRWSNVLEAAVKMIRPPSLWATIVPIGQKSEDFNVSCVPSGRLPELSAGPDKALPEFPKGSILGSKVSGVSASETTDGESILRTESCE
jgi:hypothetical protein